MNYDHPKWDEFISLLGSSISEIWCNSEINKPVTKSVLKRFEDIDIAKTFKFLESIGGYCDCEVIFNVVRYNNIKEEVEKHTILKKSRKTYIGLCPFHEEKTPSFTVDTSKNTFNCYGCGEKGGVDYFVHLIKKQK